MGKLAVKFITIIALLSGFVAVPAQAQNTVSSNANANTANAMTGGNIQFIDTVSQGAQAQAALNAANTTTAGLNLNHQAAYQTIARKYGYTSNAFANLANGELTNSQELLQVATTATNVAQELGSIARTVSNQIADNPNVARQSVAPLITGMTGYNINDPFFTTASGMNKGDFVGAQPELSAFQMELANYAMNAAEQLERYARELQNTAENLGEMAETTSESEGNLESLGENQGIAPEDGTNSLIDGTTLGTNFDEIDASILDESSQTAGTESTSTTLDETPNTSENSNSTNAFGQTTNTEKSNFELNQRGGSDRDDSLPTQLTGTNQGDYQSFGQFFNEQLNRVLGDNDSDDLGSANGGDPGQPWNRGGLNVDGGSNLPINRMLDQALQHSNNNNNLNSNQNNSSPSSNFNSASNGNAGSSGGQDGSGSTQNSVSGVAASSGTYEYSDGGKDYTTNVSPQQQRKYEKKFRSDTLARMKLILGMGMNEGQEEATANPNPDTGPSNEMNEDLVIATKSKNVNPEAIKLGMKRVSGNSEGFEKSKSSKKPKEAIEEKFNTYLSNVDVEKMKAGFNNQSVSNELINYLVEAKLREEWLQGEINRIKKTQTEDKKRKTPGNLDLLELETELADIRANNSPELAKLLGIPQNYLEKLRNGEQIDLGHVDDSTLALVIEKFPAIRPALNRSLPKRNLAHLNKSKQKTSALSAEKIFQNISLFTRVRLKLRSLKFAEEKEIEVTQLN